MDKPLRLFNKLTYLGRYFSLTKTHISICIGKEWTATDLMSLVGTSDLSDKIKQDFFQAVAIFVLQHDCVPL